LKMKSRTDFTNDYLKLAVLVLSFVATVYSLRNLSFPEYTRIQTHYTPDLTIPVGPYFYLDGWNFELSQPVLYHGLGDSISNARAADIIFVGNSRVQLGIREEFIVPLAEQHGLKVFSIGSGHAESVGFAIDVIKKHELKPKVVVILAGAHAYSDRVSAVAKATLKMSRWEAWKLSKETAFSWNVRYRLHDFIPRIGLFGNRITSRYALYRSELTGWWKPALEPHGTYKTSYKKEDENYERTLKYVSKVRTYLAGQGILLVTGVIPYRQTSYKHLAFLKEHLDIPFVHPGLELETTDSSHLNLESAKIFTSAFWREFIKLPRVRKKLFPGGKH
jgi:hypothetical protein